MFTVASVTTTATAQATGTNQRYIGMSHSAHGLPQLLNSYRHMEVSASVEIFGNCFAGGQLTRVIYTARPQYTGGTEFDHAPAMPIVIAVVEFGCDDKIIGYTYL